MKFSRIITSLSIILSLFSCSEKGHRVEESISADCESVAATSEMATYKISIVANCEWMAEILDANDEPVVWASLSRKKGYGDASLSIRVFENDYNISREARVHIYTSRGTILDIPLVQQGVEGGTEHLSLNLRVGSYNLRMASLDSDADNKWSVRKSRLQQSIIDNDFDIFGIQEVNLETQAWIRETFGTEYELWVFSPYSSNVDGSGDRAQAILYRKNKFSVSDKHWFWASATPDVGSLNDTGSNGDYRRGGHCAIFTHKLSGMKFFFMNTHGCLNREPGDTYAHVYIDKEKQYNTANLPSFFVGDMNARPEAGATTTYKTHWKDCYLTAKKKSGSENTYNGFNSPNGKNRIDYIYYRGNVVVNEFCTNNKLYGGLYASDHFPLWADVVISK